MKLIELFNFRKEDMKPEGKRNAVVALGGGGARGLAHLGAMESIGSSGVLTERIVGVSMGSLVGALCAINPDVRSVQTEAIELLNSPVFLEKCGVLSASARHLSDRDKQSEFASWSSNLYGRLRQSVANGRRWRRALYYPSILRENILRDAIEFLLPDIDISETEIPLSIVAADLLSGQRIVMERGSLREAVIASTAIPGFFPPVKWGKCLLCDVGVMDSLPIEISRSYASDLVIGVDVGNSHSTIEECETTVEIMMRMDEIAERLLRREMYKQADVVIRPEVGDRLWFDFRNPQSLINAGRTAGLHSLKPLRESIDRISTS